MITIKQISYQYADQTLALDNLSLKVAANQTLGLIGANGAGKSTLLNHLNGFFMPNQGSIAIGDLEVSVKNQELIRKQVGLVFQQPDDQLFMPQVIDDIMFGPLNMDLPLDQVKLRTEEVMRFLDIWHLKDKPPFHLSAGEKRFVAIAAILVMNPAVLVMDEPTSDLDPKNRRKLINILKTIKATKVIASHDLDFIWESCDEVAVLSRGKIIRTGSTKIILSDKDLLEAHHLELPLRLQK